MSLLIKNRKLCKNSGIILITLAIGVDKNRRNKNVKK